MNEGNLYKIPKNMSKKNKNSKKKPDRKKPESLTLKQRKWLVLYFALGNASEAAMRVYNCKNRESAAQIGYENLRKLDFTEAMEEFGITDAKLLQRVNEGLDASHKRTEITDRDDKGRPIYEYFDEDDVIARHRYLETALRLKKRLIDRVALGTGETGEEPITLVVSKAPEKEIIKEQ